MSLVRLLTCGKALTVLRDLPSAYRMRRDALLPKFGSSRDPFAPKEREGIAEVPAPPPVGVASEAAARKSIWPWSARETDGKSVTNRKAESQTRRHADRDAQMPVQGELSLDKVKVVRNDLHGSDVDLISRSIGAEKTYQQVASNLLSSANAAEQALDRLAARIVGAGAR